MCWEDLAHEGIVNRRRDDRVPWNQPAKMSWQLNPGEVDVEIKDCSPGGVKVVSEQPIPENVRLRIRVEMGDGDEAIIDAKAVWHNCENGQVQAGLAFTDRKLPEVVNRVLTGGDRDNESAEPQPLIRTSILAAAVITILGATLTQIGVWG